MPKILLVEDEASIRRVLGSILSEEDKSYQIEEATNGQEAMDMIDKRDYDLVLCDIKMPKKDGLEVLLEAKALKPALRIVMISGHGDLETAVQAMKMGAFDYIAKPPDLNRLLTTVRNALTSTPEEKTNKGEVKTSKKNSQNSPMIGKSAAIQTDVRVLITGPNGSGKELVARALHQGSERAAQPMIEVNCAAIPSELIESELFGHIKGSFTSAVKDRVGKFEAADKGTIFLDEIGDMSLSAQAKVLRALQEKKITKVGSEKDIAVDVRVIAATNKDLKQEIAQGRFREDLYHRLAVILLEVPSLNERRDDIPLLVEHFTKHICQEQGISKQFQPKAIEQLQQYDWSGNVRELRNVVERLLILSEGEVTVKDVKAFGGKE